MIELVDTHATLRGRWVRVAVFVGDAPGSHMGFWKTDTGTLKGWNYRVGKLNRCLTAFVHTRKTEQP